MEQLSKTNLAVKRIVEDWKLLLSVFMGFLIVTTVSAGAPIYLKALEQLSFNTSLDRLTTPFLNIHIFATRVTLTEEALQERERLIDEAIERHISEISQSRERYVKGSNQLATLFDASLAEDEESALNVRTTEDVEVGYFQTLSNVENHSRFLEGRMAGEQVHTGPSGPVVEVAISGQTARGFSIELGDEVTLTPDPQSPGRLTGRIVGILEPDDPEDEYWNVTGIILDPEPLFRGGPDELTPSEREQLPEGLPELDPLGLELPVPMFVTERVMLDVVGPANSGTFIDPRWFILVDTSRLKEWSLSEARTRLKAFESEMAKALPGSTITTGVVLGLIDGLEKRGFFSKIPILLLLTVLAVTVLFYLSMVVSYLVKSRERDGAMLRTRGAGTLQLLRLYGLEGLAITAVAAAPAPFIAAGAVALTGKLPYFSEITGGDFLPVRLDGTPFLAAMAAGLLCLSIFVIPGALSSRGGLLMEKVRSSRPPTVPFLFRYYLDVGLLALGGLVFWELNSRGHVVSGGLFKEVQVNEALLFAPVLFLVVVALVFIRLFPMVVRFISGESAALMHLVVSAMVVVLGLGIPVRETREGNSLAWLIPVALVLAVAAAYWGTSRARPLRLRLGGMIVQAGLVAVFLALEPLDVEGLMFTPTLVLVAMVPAQLAFMLLGAATRAAPVWLSMGLWRMARSPLQYTWLVLLLVLATGLGILSTTVGRTLVRSYEERVLYRFASDFRISGGNPSFVPGGLEELGKNLSGVPGVIATSPVVRVSGSVGQTHFQMLGLEPREFAKVSWYREDFSDKPLSDLMRALEIDVRPQRVEIPTGASHVGIWAKPDREYIGLSLWALVQDSTRRLRFFSLGGLETADWTLALGEIPSDASAPLYLLSVQVAEPSYGFQTPSGTVLFDDLHVTFGADGEKVVLEDFESSHLTWTPITTSLVRSDSLSVTREDVVEGQMAGKFSFGRENQFGIRGFYQSPTGGPLPVVVSSSLVENTGIGVGDTFVGSIARRLVPMIVLDTANHFPTVHPEAEAFVLADLWDLSIFLGLVSVLQSAPPNELYVKAEPGTVLPIEDFVRKDRRRFLFVADGASHLEAVRLDPFGTAGWSVMVVISLGVVLLAAAFGYVAYLLLYGARIRNEMGFLQSLGLSRRQLVGLISFEHLAVVASGLGLGTWAGFQMSRLMVSPLAVTEEGKEIVPPYILMTDWNMLVPTYIVLLGVIVVTLVVLHRRMRRLDLHAIARAAEY